MNSRDSNEPDSGKAATLRQQAEARVAVRDDIDVGDMSTEDIRRTLHELSVHQAELEIQNDELRRAQVELERLRERYYQLYDQAPAGYVTVSEAGLVVESNQTAATMLGASRDTLRGRRFAEFVSASDEEVYYQHRRLLDMTRGPQVCELRMARRDASTIWVRLESTVTESEGELGYRIVMSDISVQRALQARVAQADRLATVGLLAAGIAHEISNPLTFVVGNIQTIWRDVDLLSDSVAQLRDTVAAEIGDAALTRVTGPASPLLESDAFAGLTERLSEADAGLQRVSEVIKGLRSFSWSESGSTSLVDIHAAIEQALVVARNEIRFRATLTGDFRCDSPVRGSIGKLAQVFLNLLVNAAHAIHEGDPDNNQISVRTWTDGGNVFAEVTDTGSGISEEDLERVFEPFFTRKAEGKGTGLGLAISRDIVRELGGDMTITSALGEGTRVLVSLPRARREDAVAPQDVSTSPRALRRGRILVVDDEPILRRVLVRMLGADHDVVAVASVRAAREAIEADPNWDLVLSDIMLPGESGLDLHRWLLEHHRSLGETMIFASGGVLTSLHSAYLDSLDNRQIEKPFTSDVLLDEVANALALEPAD